MGGHATIAEFRWWLAAWHRGGGPRGGPGGMSRREGGPRGQSDRGLALGQVTDPGGSEVRLRRSRRPGPSPRARGRCASSPSRRPGSARSTQLINGAKSSIDLTMYELIDHHRGERPGRGGQARRRRAGDPGRAPGEVAEHRHLQLPEGAQGARDLGAVRHHLPPEDAHRRRQDLGDHDAQHDVRRTTRAPGTSRSSTPARPTSPPSSRRSTPTSRTRRSRRLTAPTWCGRRPTRRPRSSP